MAKDVTQDAQEAPRRRRGRFGLYAPFLILAIVAVAWCAFWFVARDRATEAFDAFIAREAQAGRTWTCPNRVIGGFPFRFELECEDPQFSGATPNGAVEARLKRLTALWQIYDPALVIAVLDGPLTARNPATGESARGDWSSLRVSLRGIMSASPQASLAGSGVALRAGAEGSEKLIASAETADMHVRRNPNRPDEDRAYDFVGRLERASIPALDALSENDAAAEVELQATLTQADAFGRGSRGEQIERWRTRGGSLELVLLSLAKGAQRVEAKGAVSLDALRRPQGAVQASAAGLDTIVRRVMGGRQQALADVLANGIEALGKRQKAKDARPVLLPLPPVRIADGKVFLGPIRLPIVVPPLP